MESILSAHIEPYEIIKNWIHNPKVSGSTPDPATEIKRTYENS